MVFNVNRIVTFVYSSGHHTAICDLASDADRVASSDDTGQIIIWQAGGEHIQQLCSIKPNG